MRNRAILSMTLAVLFLASSLVLLGRPSSAATFPTPKLYLSIAAEDVGANPRFGPRDAQGATIIIVPQVPIVLNITLIFDSVMDHTFTIRSTAAGAADPYLVNVNLPTSMGRGNSKTVEFTIFAADRIVFGGRNETVEVQGPGIRFFCIPHEPVGMVGSIVVGGVQQQEEQPEKGVFLRAYWIGLLGFAATMLLVGISYFVIKGSSPRYRDHHEHIRRGGP